MLKTLSAVAFLSENTRVSRLIEQEGEQRKRKSEVSCTTKCIAKTP